MSADDWIDVDSEFIIALLPLLLLLLLLSPPPLSPIGVCISFF
jgi:hypothetical protein